MVDSELRRELAYVVYAATHVVLPRRVRLKVTQPDGIHTAQVARQMLREACLLEAMQHPGIPRIYECGMLADRRPWVALERPEGVSFATQVAAGNPGDLIQLLRDVGDVLSHAHSRGVIHRQLTAESIVRVPDRAFPICIIGWDHALTYDSEQPVALNPRDDIFTLGMVVFRALTGRLPEPGVPTARLAPTAAPALASLLDNMLVGDASRRLSSAEVRDRAAAACSERRPPRAETQPPVRTPEAESEWQPGRMAADAIPVIQEEDGFSVRINSGRVRAG